ncbi:hypothetical protein BCR35DRAFT_86741 [Leucosporidium creatinivorum]|uniref:Uncharacterized protein n=1 Tax=Leucosporidium creatinivorum TaxID=106004 RepID=A0A1Y2FBB0_9BASI|nr:hypothetical protein BCR35DRAFT_86741 [Leucosporidium creatinivorum]
MSCNRRAGRDQSTSKNSSEKQEQPKSGRPWRARSRGKDELGRGDVSCALACRLLLLSPCSALCPIVRDGSVRFATCKYDAPDALACPLGRDASGRSSLSCPIERFCTLVQARLLALPGRSTFFALESPPDSKGFDRDTSRSVMLACRIGRFPRLLPKSRLLLGPRPRCSCEGFIQVQQVCTEVIEWPRCEKLGANQEQDQTSRAPSQSA